MQRSEAKQQAQSWFGRPHFLIEDFGREGTVRRGCVPVQGFERPRCASAPLFYPPIPSTLHQFSIAPQYFRKAIEKRGPSEQRNYTAPMAGLAAQQTMALHQKTSVVQGRATASQAALHCSATAPALLAYSTGLAQAAWAPPRPAPPRPAPPSKARAPPGHGIVSAGALGQVPRHQGCRLQGVLLRADTSLV